MQSLPLETVWMKLQVLFSCKTYLWKCSLKNVNASLFLKIKKTYCMRPNYCTEPLGFSKLLRKFVIKYVSTIYLKKKKKKKKKKHQQRTKKKKKKKKHQQRTYLMMLKWCFQVCVYIFSDFLYKSILWVLIWIASTCWCNSDGYPQHMSI